MTRPNPSPRPPPARSPPPFVSAVLSVPQPGPSAVPCLSRRRPSHVCSSAHAMHPPPRLAARALSRSIAYPRAVSRCAPQWQVARGRYACRNSNAGRLCVLASRRSAGLAHLIGGDNRAAAAHTATTREGSTRHSNDNSSVCIWHRLPLFWNVHPRARLFRRCR